MFFKNFWVQKSFDQLKTQQKWHFNPLPPLCPSMTCVHSEEEELLGELPQIKTLTTQRKLPVNTQRRNDTTGHMKGIIHGSFKKPS